ncbi:hypothetical protein FNF27_07603 [Cafeteria roenbergensis]|uniref:Uncharacterized protein n=1 Tax=Cafeteria roenbergensis TaxID=33653 RepID=A0A5A8DKG1_CAFRO|nr:hypothetical protein FNF27_07603 [Cafeteria roenbergensis]
MASVRNFLDTLSKLEVPGAAVSLPAALPLPSFAFSGATAATSEAPGAPHSAGITAPALTGSDLATSEADHGVRSLGELPGAGSLASGQASSAAAGWEPRPGDEAGLAAGTGGRRRFGKRHKADEDAYAREQARQERLQQLEQRRASAAQAGSTASGPDDPAETTHIYEPFSVRHGLSPSAWSKRYERSKKNIRVPWTHEETSALEQGVRRFGTRWSTILRAPGLGEPLVRNARSSVDLKDKWRNWSNRLRKARNPLGWVASKDPVPRDVFLRALQEKIPLRGTPGFQAAMALSDPGSPDRAAKHTGGRPPAVPVQPVVDVGLPPSDPVSAAAALQAAATTLPGASGAAPAASAALSLGMPGLPVSVSMLTASSLSATALLPSGSLTQQALPAPGELTQPPSTVGAPTPGASAKRTRSTLADASAAVGGTATSEMLGLSAAEAAEPSAKRPALAEQAGQGHRQAGGDAASQSSPVPGPSFSAPSGADASSASPVQFRVTHLSTISLGHAPSAPLTLGAKPHDVMAAVVQQAKSAFGVDSDAFLLVDVQIPKGFSVASNRRTVEQYYGSEARTVELVALSGEGCAEAAAALLHGGIAKQ